jgi:hypothetical protein
MSKIKDIVKTPSAALQAMVDGLREQSKRSDFKIDMHTYGAYNPGYGVCFGCAATCATQKIFETKFQPDFINTVSRRAEAFKCEMYDLHEFEQAINSARIGVMSKLFLYYDIVLYGVKDVSFLPEFSLCTDNWEAELPKVEKYIACLQQYGF